MQETAFTTQDAFPHAVGTIRGTLNGMLNLLAALPSGFASLTVPTLTVLSLFTRNPNAHAHRPK